MNRFVTNLQTSRFRLVLVLVGLLLSISLITRLCLTIYSWPGLDFSVANIGGIWLFGLFFDLANASYFMLPLLVLLWVVPRRIFRTKVFRSILFSFFFLLTFILLFTAAAEGFFWNEFSTRFNFIAVDYLVYTTEVIGNIRQSYPVEWLIAALLAVSFIITYALRGNFLKSGEVPMDFRRRTLWFLGFLALPVLNFFFVKNDLHRFSDNTYVNELSGNGMYELFSAYLNNELDYDQFYPTLNGPEMEGRIRYFSKVSESFTPLSNNFVQRQVRGKGPERKMNVIFISVESLSAEFMQAFGNSEKITPFLDSLASTGLLFSNLYATGTRTVRGLEALALSVPPTPGQSIVRRPNNENLFTMASVFNAKGYESKFIFGGYAYFDNMGYFFGHNGYEVVDRSAVAPADIDAENIWGIADENLFTLALREIDKSVDHRKPVFAHIMTTSNHRPYTYPEGRIDIPSHTGRAGAVKYTDYALGKFIKEAAKRPWFANSLFVIVADHCASSAGKTELPLQQYHIPMIIYSPAFVSPGTQARLMSQIDIAPTLFGMLDFSYTSKFYGYDLNSLPVGDERAFISTYQLLGYVKSDSLVILAPKKEAEVFQIGNDRISVRKVAHVEPVLPVVKEAITWYQTASRAFKTGAMKYEDGGL